MKRVTFFLLLVCFFSSCSNFSGHLTKRYKSIEVIKNDSIIKNRIDVNAYVIEEKKGERSESKTIFDLSPDAQAVLISELAKKDTTTDAFISGLTRSLSSKSSDATKIADYSQFETRIVVSIRNKSHMPADRIAKINVTLDIGNNGIKFLSCDRLITEYQTLDLGKLNYSNTQSGELAGKSLIEAGREDAIKGEGAGEGKLSASRSFSEEILLKQRMVALNAAITQDKLSLYQEGISGIDLTGNILADITLGVKNLKVEKIYSFRELVRNGVKNNSGDVKVNEKFVIYPNIIKDLKATITFDADFREVSKKHQTISESDDMVKLYYGTVKDTTNKVVIIPIREMKPNLWKLTDTLSTDCKKGIPIQIKNTTTLASGDLLFDSSDEAKNFLAWLKLEYDNEKNSNIVVGSNYEVIIPHRTMIQDIQVEPYD